MLTQALVSSMPIHREVLRNLQGIDVKVIAVESREAVEI